MRTIPIQRKLRQRKGVKVVSPERKEISGGVEKKKQLPVTPTQKKQMPSSTTEKKKAISPISPKPSGTRLNEQAKITSKKDISSVKKPISTEETEEKSPISTEKKSKKKSTSTSTQEGKGSDILKKVFGTEQSGTGTQGTKKESSPQRQGQTSSVGEVLSGFQSGSGSEGRQQK